jgi:pimeloyl-ACP methyl ester carboxylesterase
MASRRDGGARRLCCGIPSAPASEDRPSMEPVSRVTDASVAYPGAREPDRTRRVDAFGVQIAVYEWGDAEAPPLLLAHGGFDFARTFDVFAPRLAAGGFRVVAWDQRGHGRSAQTHLYSWDADVRDAFAVLESTSSAPLVAVGHSKGGGVLMQLVHALPERFTRFVNVDGVPARRPASGLTEHEGPKSLNEMATEWLDHRRRVASLVRKAGTAEELALRRQRMNPRLPLDWLRHLVSVGAQHDPDGWRWCVDPSLRFGGFGPWRPEWVLERLRRFPVPLYVILGLVPEAMSMGSTPESVQPYLPPAARVHAFEDSGHFVHIEKPKEVADLVLGFLT